MAIAISRRTALALTAATAAGGRFLAGPQGRTSATRANLPFPGCYARLRIKPGQTC
jgi:hypothetical protein